MVSQVPTARVTARLFPSTPRPAALVVGAPLSTGLQTAASDAQRDRAFLDAVVGTLRGDGSVLVPCDASARVLEVLALLDAHWQANRELHVYRSARVHGRGGCRCRSD